MTESIHSRLDKHLMDHGRTHLDPDGGYRSYDLVGARRGTRIGISVVDPVDSKRDQASYYLLKKEDVVGAAARDGWELMHQKRRLGRKRKVGKGAVTLFGRAKDSGPFRMAGVVLKHGLEIGIPDPRAPNVIKNMGAIASMSHMEEQRTVRERLKELLGHITIKEEL